MEFPSVAVSTAYRLAVFAGINPPDLKVVAQSSPKGDVLFLGLPITFDDRGLAHLDFHAAASVSIETLEEAAQDEEIFVALLRDLTYFAWMSENNHGRPVPADSPFWDSGNSREVWRRKAGQDA